MSNSWTGGQYSLFRAAFGAYLLVHFAQLLPWGAELFSSAGALPHAEASPLAFLFPNVLSWFDPPWFVLALLASAVMSAALFALGWRDREAAVWLWYVWACLFGRNPLIANPGLPYVGWMLLAHACLPRAPYGSLAAVGRSDPGGSWRMPGGIFAAAWILMALGYTFSGVTKLASPSWFDGSALTRVLDNPLARPGPARQLALEMPDVLMRGATWGALALELAFAPLALLRRARPWLWTVMLLLHLSLIALIDFADLSMGMVMLHLLTFDPGWIPPRPARGEVPERLFYDGTCGLCHRAVRFVLAEDPEGRAFRFAPLQGETFRVAVPEEEAIGLPDSLVLMTGERTLLTRSAVVLHLLDRLGGLWRVLAVFARVVPSGVRDRVYGGIARVRYRLFARPSEACPLVPQHLRARFDP